MTTVPRTALADPLAAQAGTIGTSFAHALAYLGDTSLPRGVLAATLCRLLAQAESTQHRAHILTAFLSQAAQALTEDQS
jgi:hypothetical protein